MKVDIEEIWGEKPTGGFVQISVGQMLSVWWCYEVKEISFYSLRVWLALHELPARRCRMGSDAKPIYRVSELMELTNQKRRSLVKAAITELESCGLVQCRRSQIRFPRLPKKLEDDEQFCARLSLIKNNRRRVPFPRRMLRHLAGRSRATTVATVFGHLLRLLYQRKMMCRADGCCKASWIAEVFSLDVASVKRGRAALVRLGFLEKQSVPAWYRNRFGWRGFVNLDWDAVDNTVSAELSSGKKLPSLSHKLQKTDTPKAKPVSPFGRSKPSSGKACRGDQRKLFFGRRLGVTDLSENSRLEVVFKQAIAGGWVSNADRLHVYSAAEKALRIASKVDNAVGVFLVLVRRKKWDFIPQCDEDSAQMRLSKESRRCSTRRSLEPDCARGGSGFQPNGHKPSRMRSISEILPTVMRRDFRVKSPQVAEITRESAVG